MKKIPSLFLKTLSIENYSMLFKYLARFFFDKRTPTIILYFFKFGLAAIPCFIILSICQPAKAQNILKIQTKSIEAPANIKIDGKNNDWNNKFEAYNNSTGLFYSIANDNNNLYLIIQATDPLIEKKILRGGITISLRGFEKDKHSLKITFPLLEEDLASGIGVYLNENNLTEIKNGTLKKHDSLIMVMNSKLTSSVNKIGVKGTVLIADSVISIYNDRGIRIAALFNNKAALIYEFAIPLKYVPGHIGQGIDYDIKSNGIFTRVKVVMLDPSVNPNTAGLVVVGSSISGKTSADIQVLDNDTNFSGKYQLAKVE